MCCLFPITLLSIILLGESLFHYLLFHLSKVCEQTEQQVVLQIQLLALFKDEYNISSNHLEPIQMIDTGTTVQQAPSQHTNHPI